MRKVLVLGLPRGGTTWIGESLGHAAGAVYVHEPDGVHDPFAYRARVRDGIDHYAIVPPERAAPEYERLWRGAFSGGATGGVRDRVARAAFSGVSTSERQRARASGKLGARLRLAVAAAVPRRGRPALDAVVVKSVNAALAADWIADRFAPQVVVVQRDLRNVIASWLAIGFGEPRPAVYDAFRAELEQRFGVVVPSVEDPTSRIATLCATMTLALADSSRRHPDWHVISHDAACAAPAATLERAARNLGLQWTAEADDFVRRSDRAGTGYSTNRLAADLPDQWKARLDGEQVARIDALLDLIPRDLWTVSPSA